MLKDISTEEDVKYLVDTFYNQVLSDPEIGFIFTDVAKISLEHHMPIMYSFWSSMLLNTNTYKGNPMMKHLALNAKTSLKEKHFNRWLMLWESTITTNFNGPKAAEAINRAKLVAVVMQRKISSVA